MPHIPPTAERLSRLAIVWWRGWMTGGEHSQSMLDWAGEAQALRERAPSLPPGRSVKRQPQIHRVRKTTEQRFGMVERSRSGRLNHHATSPRYGLRVMPTRHAQFFQSSRLDQGSARIGISGHVAHNRTSVSSITLCRRLSPLGESLPTTQKHISAPPPMKYCLPYMAGPGTVALNGGLKRRGR